MRFYFLVSFLSFIITFALTPIMKKIATRFGVLDKPTSTLKTHKAPTPYLGGVAIFGGAMGTFGIVYFMTPELLDLKAVIYIAILAGVFTLGLIDDIRPIRPITRLIFHFVFAGILVSQGFHINAKLPLFMDYIISMFWIAGVINAMNIIDIMDGLATGVALSICLCLFASFYFLGLNTSTPSFYIVAVSIVIGCCLGFLPSNFERASIFMGDAGSTLLGFMLASLTLQVPVVPKDGYELFVPIFFLAVPLFDVALVSVIRLRKGMSPFKGSRDHFALRLKEHGVPVKEIVINSYIACILAGMMAVVLMVIPMKYKFLPIFIVFVGGYMFASFLNKVKMEKPKA